MTTPTSPPHDESAPASREEMLSALFANMVIQQTNTAMIFLGKAAHPETGEIVRDVDTAKMFIDQLEMLEVKTKGNLNKQEEALMKQALTALRMAFVEAVDAPIDTPKPAAEPAAPGPAPESAPRPAAGEPAAPAASAPSATEESRKKFTKKY